MRKPLVERPKGRSKYVALGGGYLLGFKSKSSEILRDNIQDVYEGDTKFRNLLGGLVNMELWSP